jgi:glutamate dehydrogenase (NADP+)
LSDSNGTIVDKDGIDAEKLAWVIDLKTVRRGRIKEYVSEFKNARYLEGQRPWSVECDLAFPSATQNEISAVDAKELVKNGCTLISEGANMPTDQPAIEVFQEAQIMFGPGKAANAGGVAVSGLEMSQNSERLSWTREEVDTRLQGIMRAIHETCVEYGRESDTYVDYVKGANIGGFVKVADAMLDQGIV